MDNRIYISGKITGEDNYQLRFAEAEDFLLQKGYKRIENPVKICSHLNPNLHTWEQYMLVNIEVLFRCNSIFMLKNWIDSKGACIEHDIAKRLGLLILYQD